MTNRIDITAPASITVLAGNLAVGGIPPNAIVINDPAAGGTTAVTLVAANAGAVLQVSLAGPAVVNEAGNTLVVSGSAAAVNAALATLLLTETAAAGTDTVTIIATDPAALTGQTAIAVAIAPAGGPAFAAPPATLTARPDVLTTVAGLVIGDPSLAGLIAAGQGAAETLSLTMSTANGLLFLPALTALDGIAATGLGTGTVALTFTGDQLAAVNAALARLDYIGDATYSGIAYGLRDVAGPLGPAYTNGNINIGFHGAAGAAGTFALGGQTLILGAQSLAAGAVLEISGSTANLGGIKGQGALMIGADATLAVAYDGIGLSGSSLDFGLLSAAGLNEAGGIIIANGAQFSAPVTLGGAGFVDFNGLLSGNAAAATVQALAFSLNAGAVLEGDGTLIAGNFSESGVISGPGTIAVQPGATLLLAAGSLGGGAVLDVAAGGVMLLGPVDPLYGVFNATPLTIDSAVTIDFSGLPNAAVIGGGFADTLDQNGGVLVIAGPQVFAGSIANFSPGDRLVFPGLSDINLYDITANGFNIAGIDSGGTTQTYLIHASYQAGLHPFLGTDLAGDAEVSLRDAQADVFVNGASWISTEILASADVPQPIEGLYILPYLPSTLAATVTLTVAQGTLAVAGLAPGATLTVSAAGPAALNSALAGLVYTGDGVADALYITSTNGALNGLAAEVVIAPVLAGAVTTGFAGASAGDTALFDTASLAPVTQDAAPGALLVTALTSFEDDLRIGGALAAAITVDDAAAAIFGAAAMVAAGGDVMVGDAGGAGSIAVLTAAFTVGSQDTPADFILGAAPNAGGSAADIAGILGVSGTLAVGALAAAGLDLSGALGAAATSIGQAGTLLAHGGATAAFGRLFDAGTLFLVDMARASTGTAAVAGTLELGGTALLNISGPLTIATLGQLRTGPDTTLQGQGLSEAPLGTLVDDGMINLASLSAAGSISLGGGLIDAGSISLGLGAVLSGFGSLVAPGIANAGTIVAAGGLLLLAGNVSNGGSIEIGAAAALDATHGVSGGAISFTGINAVLTINDVGVFTAGVANMAASDVVDLIGVAPTLVGFANGTITARDTAGLVLGSFALGLAAGAPAVTVVADGHGGALITSGDEMPCFVRGSRLLTPTGYRPVEALAPGDPLITAAGDRRPIRWIGRRTLDLAGAAADRPVLVAAHAFGPGRPLRPLRLSPLHAVWVRGVLVPVMHLVNGATIKRESGPAAVTYYHVELDRHDVVLAEGLACESYLDGGNRGAMYQERGVRTPARLAYARRITTGGILAAIRRDLHATALAAGFTLTYRPRLRAVTADASVIPRITLQAGRRVARFAMGPAAARLTLLSDAATPADTDPDSEDRRELGICLRQASAARIRPALGAGWLPRGAGDAGVWMGRRSELLFAAPVAALTLTLAAIVQSWAPPVDRTGLPP